MIRSITGNFWSGGSGVMPAVPVFHSIGGISDTTIRVSPGFTAYAAFIEIWRADTETGTYALIGTLYPTDLFYDDATLSPEVTKWYKMRAGAGVNYSAFSPPASATTLSAIGIERNLWQNLTNYLRTNSHLAGYINTFKFDLEAKILGDSQYPILKGWVLKTTELWIGVPKCKIVKIHFALHGLVESRDEPTLELEKLQMSENIKDALEADDMDIAGAGTLNLVGDTLFRNMDSYRAEIFQEAEIWSVKFKAGFRS